MLGSVKSIIKSLTFNIKTLIYFEIIYRLIGVLIIFPLTRILFIISIRLSGFKYVTNKMLMEYLLKPSTILILLLLLLILSIYLVIEIIYLSLLYDLGYHEKRINIKSFLAFGIRHVLSTIKKYHVFIIIPAFLLFIIVQLIQFTGVATTLSIPDFILKEIRNMAILKYISFILVGVTIVLFIETIYFINIFTIDKLNLKLTFKENQRLLRRGRMKIFFEFIFVNLILNILLYGFYLSVILIAAGFIYITFGQELVLGFLLTILYIIYLIIAFFANIILIPINYALIANWYYKGNEKNDSNIHKSFIIYNKYKPINKIFFRRIIIIFLAIIFTLNVTSIVSLIKESKVQVELFHYPLIIAHRGASIDAPENTISAIELAINQGADIIEIDIRESNDNVPILMHDVTLGRTTSDPFNLRVDNVNLDYIKSLDAGSWFSSSYKKEEVPTLEEVLEFINGRTKLIIELKVNNTTLTKNVVDLVEQYMLVDDVMIMSYSNNQLYDIKNYNKNIETILVVTTFYGNINALINSNYINNFAFEKEILLKNPGYIELFKYSQKDIFVWTVNSEKNLRIFVENDIDGIITDYPILAREVAYSKNKKSIFYELLNKLFSK